METVRPLGVLCVVAIACGGPAGKGQGYPTAPHDPFPQVLSQGGPVLASPQVVTITFADDPHRAELEVYGAFLVTSTWLKAVGKDYGVGAATHQAVELKASAPAQISDDQIQALLQTQLANGTLPALASPANDIYLLYFPVQTAVTGADGTRSCSDFSGYHSEPTAGPRYAYVVVASCPTAAVPSGPPADLESTASHEVIEAATDPYPVSAPAFELTDVGPWNSTSGGEVGDLCAQDNETEGPYTFQRIWSNSAAALGNASPCVPSAAAAYYNDSSAPAGTQHASPGGTVTFALTGWSSAAAPPWTLTVVQLPAGLTAPDVNMPQITIGSTTLENALSTPFSVTIPADAPVPSVALLWILNGSPDSPESYWPVLIEVP